MQSENKAYNEYVHRLLLFADFTTLFVRQPLNEKETDQRESRSRDKKEPERNFNLNECI